MFMATVKEKMDALRAEYLGTSDRARRDEINAEIAKLNDEYPEEAEAAFWEQLDGDLAEIRTNRIKERLGPISDALNWSFIARTYFHRSRSWLYQRLNGNIHNGKVERFTSAEAAILDNALKDIAEKLKRVAIK